MESSCCCRQLFPSTVFLLLGVPGVPDVSGPAQPGPSRRNKRSGNEIPGKTPPRLLLPFPWETAAPLVLLQGVRGAHGQGCGSADLPGPFRAGWYHEPCNRTGDRGDKQCSEGTGWHQHYWAVQLDVVSLLPLSRISFSCERIFSLVTPSRASTQSRYEPQINHRRRP